MNRPGAEEAFSAVHAVAVLGAFVEACDFIMPKRYEIHIAIRGIASFIQACEQRSINFLRTGKEADPHRVDPIRTCVKVDRPLKDLERCIDKATLPRQLSNIGCMLHGSGSWA